MKILKVDSKGIDLIKGEEGFKLKPYLCPSGVPTIGYGTTRYPNGTKVNLNDREITNEEAVSFLQYDIKVFELNVDAMATDSLNQNQFNALTSFSYNLGSQALRTSTLLRKVNANLLDKTIRDEFNKWVHGEGGNILPGLVKRRKDEADMYFS